MNLNDPKSQVALGEESRRLFIFDNCIEIVSPGHLPNNLTVAKIRAGNSIIRNPILVSYIAKGLLPYRGLGSGIKWALDDWMMTYSEENSSLMPDPSTSGSTIKEEQPMATNQPIGWVLYDDACGFCREWIPFWGPTLRQVGLEIAPLQAPWVRERLNMSPEELVFDIRLLFVDGRHLAGAEVYRYAVQQIWWAYPLYLFSVTPGLRWLWDWGYGAFRDHRHQISAACGLPSPTSASSIENHPRET